MKNGYSIYWDGVKKELEGFLSQNDLHIFINRINYHDFKPKTNISTLSVPSNFIKDNVTKFKNDIESTLFKISGYKCSVKFIVIIPKNQDTNNKSSKPTEVVKKENLLEKKKKIIPTKIDIDNKIDDYSFDSFIIGNSNEFAAKAARAVAENPGTQYNPYFVWGDSGLGKTHLLKSIEKYTRDHFPSKKVKYVTSEEFTNDFVNYLSTKKMEQFRIKYRKLDVLLLDDVQFFANKEGIQAEFFNTFNKLYDDFKQMVFSCDQPIKKVKKMEDRLKSRFAMGLVVDLRPPDFELKMAILKNMSEIYSLNIEFNAMEYICTNIGGNIRDLKSAFKILQAYSSIMKKSIDLAIAKETLKERLLADLHLSPISVDKIIQIVAEYFNHKAYDITGTKRTQSIVLARQIAMYISRKITRLSTTQIGKYFGDKEHGTVMHATKKIEDLITKDTKIKKDIEILIENIKSE